MSEHTESHLHKESSNNEWPHQETLTSEDTLVQVENRQTSAHSEMTLSIARKSMLYECHYCKYSSERKASLTRHLRRHDQFSGTPGLKQLLVDPPMAKYCANCDIQFREYKNYLAHKEFYCNARHICKSMNSFSPLNSGNQDRASLQNQTFEPLAPENLLMQPPESTLKDYNMVLNRPLSAVPFQQGPLMQSTFPTETFYAGRLSAAAGLIPANNINIPNPSATPYGEVEFHGTNVIPVNTVMPGVSAEIPSVSFPAPVTKDIARQHSEFYSLQSSDSGHPIPIFTSSSAFSPSEEGNTQTWGIQNPWPIINPVETLNLTNKNHIYSIEFEGNY